MTDQNHAETFKKVVAQYGPAFRLTEPAKDPHPDTSDRPLVWSAGRPRFVGDAVDYAFLMANQCRLRGVPLESLSLVKMGDECGLSLEVENVSVLYTDVSDRTAYPVVLNEVDLRNLKTGEWSNASEQADTDKSAEGSSVS